MTDASSAFRSAAVALAMAAFSMPVTAQQADRTSPGVPGAIAAHDDRGSPTSLDEGKFGANLDDGSSGGAIERSLTAPR